MPDPIDIGAPGLHMAFMIGCLVLLAVVYSIPWFDLRRYRMRRLRLRQARPRVRPSLARMARGLRAAVAGAGAGAGDGSAAGSGSDVTVHREPPPPGPVRDRRPEVEVESRDLVERTDLGTVLNLVVIVGTGLAALIGWRVPEEIERVYGAGAEFGLLFPSVEMTPLGRGAQVVGALCLGLVAYRLLRLLVVFAGISLIVAIVLLAIDYVFALGLLSLLV